MNVFLDTNVLCEDFHFVAKNFRVFLSESSRVPARTFLPQVVFDETVNKYKERLEASTTESIKLARIIGRLLERDITPYLDEQTVSEQVKAYRTELQQRLADTKITLLPYPQVSHEKIVQRALARRRPFRAGGAGYRDTLIWETLISFCYGEGDASTIAFVTCNQRDFGRGPELPADLDAECRQRLIDPTKIKIYSGIDDFNQSCIIPHLESLVGLKKRLATHGVEGSDLQDWIVTGLSGILDREEISFASVGFDPYYGSVSLRSIDRIQEVNVLDAKQLSSGKVLVSAAARLEVVINVSADYHDWEQSAAVRGFFGSGDFEWASATIPSTMNVRFSLFLSPATCEAFGAELDGIEGEAGSLQINEVPRSDA